MKIFKYTLKVTDTQLIEMPIDSVLLNVQTQGDKCCMWALCKETSEKEFRMIAIYGTGEQLPNYHGDYVGTFQMQGGLLVFHVFDMGVQTNGL